MSRKKIFLSLFSSIFLLISLFTDVWAESVSSEISFQEVSQSAGINKNSITYGPNFGDYDNDGWLDIFVSNHGNPPSLYHNNKNGTFTEKAQAVGLYTYRKCEGDAGYANPDRHGCAWGDYDNDGDLDLYCITGAVKGEGTGCNQLFKNNNGLFSEVATELAIRDEFGRGRSANWIDVDKDGDLDLFVGNIDRTGYSDILFENRSPNSFFRRSMPKEDYLWTEGSTWADYDNDGDLDLLIAPVDLARLYRNNGSFSFTNVSGQTGITNKTNILGSAWGDYDNDGDLDLYLVNRNNGEKDSLFENLGNGRFTEVTNKAGITNAKAGLMATWADFNNDGYLDLYISNRGTNEGGNQANVLYRNNGNKTFTNVAVQAKVEALVAGRGSGVAVGDYNNDGFLDLFVTNGEDTFSGLHQLFKNLGNGNNWLKIKLAGSPSQKNNRFGIGAKIWITVEGQTQYRELNDGVTYHSQDSQVIHFGLGRTQQVSLLRLRWPNGTVKEFINIAANQTITINDSQPSIRNVILKYGTSDINVDSNGDGLVNGLDVP